MAGGGDGRRGAGGTRRQCTAQRPLTEESSPEATSEMERMLNVSGQNPFPGPRKVSGSGVWAKGSRTSHDGMKTEAPIVPAPPPPPPDAFQCFACARAFRWACLLRRHLRVHTGERPFECTVCHRRFGKSSNLARHRRFHAGARPFPCPACGRGFATASDLRVHQRTHTGERPFQCPDCLKRFSTSGHLVRHQRTHRG
ncbi:zinc finger protein 764-like isoform X2 [Narcine bancroftii]|uniref:zinc finger protein 764-like isoform X2 n=1 Tax=Narcine bancroftii TaxID=1343680 RepID=UPI003831AF8A